MAKYRNKTLVERLESNRELTANTRSREYSSSRSTNYGYRLTGGYHYGDQKRNVWNVAGYPDKVDFDLHWNMQARFGIAKAGIMRIVNKCWQSAPTITDGEFDGERQLTQFEKDVNYLIEKKHLFQRLKGLDWRQRVGRYAGLLPIVKEPGQKNSPDKPMKKLNGVQSILKLVPVFESQIDVSSSGTITDLNDPRYGMPEYYNYREEVAGDRNPINNNEFQLHPTRVFPFAEGADDGSIYGIPVNESGFNSLLDLEKVIASGAEGLFKNAKQRTVVNINDNQVANTIATDKTKRDKWEQTADDFASGFDTMLTTYGMDINTLQSTLADPTHPFTNALNCYAASIEIPATILIGQQTGRLASDEDQSDFAQTAESRRETLLTPMIKDFIDYMVERGALTKPSNEVIVTWEPLTEPNTGDKVANAKTMQETNKVAYDSGAPAIYTTEEIRTTAGFEPQPEEDFEEFEEGDPEEDDELQSLAT